MSTYEDRIEALERKVLNLELHRLTDQQKAEMNVPKELGRDLREIKENETMLVGLFFKETEHIKAIEESANTISERVGRIETRLDGMDRHFEDVDQSLNEIKGVLAQILARLPEKP